LKLIASHRLRKIHTQADNIPRACRVAHLLLESGGVFMCLPDAAGTWSVPIQYFIALNNIINAHLQFNLSCGLGDLEMVLHDSAAKPLYILFNTQFNLL
jgi:hypothetical protein